MSSSGSNLLKLLEDGVNLQSHAAGSSSPLLNGLSQYPNGVRPSQPSLRKRPSEPEDDFAGSLKRFKAEDAISEYEFLVQGSTSTPSNTKGARDKSTFRLNYDYETRVESIDRSGPNQEQEIHDFVNSNKYRSDFEMTVAEATEKLGLESTEGVLPGMNVRLLRHQILGVTWMVRQEKETRYKGGILADEMGLGKTVQMITAMALNAADPDNDREPKTTLIVMPVALLAQWKEEIDTKTNDLFKAYIHHGKFKLKTEAEIDDYDVIITSYTTLVNDFALPKEIHSDEETLYIHRNSGVLARKKWYRVILDEGQLVRNRGTQASRAVARLKSKYRWVLSGTPITNTLADLYGMIRFGHFRPWNSWEDFDGYVAKIQMTDPPLAGLRAQEILRPLLLRRTKGDKLEGKPLLQLPVKNIEIVRLEFTPDERTIYNNFESRAQMTINRFIRRNMLIRSHAAILVMILRLRQLCCHPNLILSTAEGYEDPSLIVAGNDTDRELSKAIKTMGRDWVNRIKARMIERAKKQGQDFDDDSEEVETMSCPTCQDLFGYGNNKVLECGHEMCRECLEELVQAPMPHNDEFPEGSDAEIARREKEFDAASRRGARPCPKCRRYFDPSKVFNGSAFEPSEEEMRNIRRQSLARRKAESADSDSGEGSENESSSDEEMPDLSELLAGKKEKKKPKKSSKDSEEDRVDANGGKPSEQMLQTWTRDSYDLEPSAKMAALIEQIKAWDEESKKDDKMICYSQWTSMLDLVETLLQKHRIQHLRYDGKMSREAREQALITFKKAGGPRVILISTRAGSVGLNLVCANRVINLDLSWNYAAESQAYDRVHRVGQSKGVFIKRYIIKDTIEERMLQLQDVKLSLSDAALGEGTIGSKLTKMSVRELKALFGMDKPKENANITDYMRPGTSSQ